MEPILLRLDTRINNYASIDLMQGYNYTLEAHITDDYKEVDLTGVTVQLQMQKPDKKFIIQTENIIIEGNKIKATLDKDFTREDGQAKLQVVLFKDNFTFGSWVVKAKIKPSAINDNDGQSENKVTITEALVNKISEAENTKIELDKSIANGDVATIKGNVDKIKDVEIPKINEQLETIENKLLNPELFRSEGDTDQIVLEKAINYATTNNLELHLYKNYNIKNLVINKSLVLICHRVTLFSTEQVNVFIEVINGAKLFIKNILSLECEHANVGLLNNDSEIDIEELGVSKAKECCVRYKKTSTKGFGEIYYLKTYLSPIGLHLDTTDVKIKRYQGFCCLTHIKNSGGGNFIENAHGWQLKDSNYGDWVTNSTMLDITGGSCVITNLYADTTENAVKLPSDQQYTLISIINLVYFLNRTYYPDGINRPYLFKNIENFGGQLSCKNIQADNSAWRDNRGEQVELIDSVINENKISIDGICNNGFLDNNNCLTPTSGDLYKYISDESSEYFSPYTRKYHQHKKQKNILIQCSMKASIPNNAIAYTCKLLSPFDKIDSLSVYNAFVNNNGDFVNMNVKLIGGVLTVTNKSGGTISSGGLTIYIEKTIF